MAVQLWSFHSELAVSVPATLARIKDMGFDEVETASIPGRSPAQLRADLDAAGLKAMSAHIDYETLRDHLPDAIAAAKLLGVEQFGVSAIKIFGAQGYHELTFADADEAGEAFSKACAAARAAGLRVFLHIHGNELKPRKGGTALDRMIRKARGCFDLQVDIYWVKSKGLDPAAFIRRYGSKVRSLHVKDMAPPGIGGQPFQSKEWFPPLGKGTIDVPAVLRAARAAGVRHYIIEDESGQAASQIPQSLGYLATLPRGNGHHGARPRP